MIETIFPLAETPVRTKTSGEVEVVEREPRDDFMSPVTGVPAGSPPTPLSSVAAKWLPGVACVEIGPLVRTAMIVPVGTVAANAEWCVVNAVQTKIRRKSFLFMVITEVEVSVQSAASPVRSDIGL